MKIYRQYNIRKSKDIHAKTGKELVNKDQINNVRESSNLCNEPGL
jgi:hypothetical protein